MSSVYTERSHVIVSGVVWNFFGQGWVLVITFLATPYIVRTLQADLYGLYALAGFVLSYFAFLEFGLGAAVTKYVSQYLAEGNQEEIVNSFWSGLVWLVAGGLASVLLVYVFAWFIASTLLRVPARLLPTAVMAFRISSLLFCVTMWIGLTTGILRSVGRFAILNLTSVVAGTLQIVLSVGLLWTGYSLVEMLWAMLLCQTGLFSCQLRFCLHFLPAMRRPRFSRRGMTRLLRFGGILTLSSFIGPMLTNVEKLFMARLISVAELTYYAVPFSLIDRLAFIPSAFGAVLFPSYSYFSAKGQEYNRELHYRGTLYVCASYGFFASFFLFLGKQFLTAWMGADFAERSALVLAILAIGGMFNAMARPAVTALQAVGKPHIPLVFHCVELVLYIPSAYFCIRSFGMTGAAAAWSLRVSVDALLLHIASCLELGEKLSVYWTLVRVIALPLMVSSLAFGAIAASGKILVTPVAIAELLAIASVYAVLVWRLVLDAHTRERVAVFWKWA